MEEFTSEEREYIDRLLEESDELQRKNGNILIPTEEVFDKIRKTYNYKEKKHRIYN